jgi:hypothetical protein
MIDDPARPGKPIPPAGLSQVPGAKYHRAVSDLTASRRQLAESTADLTGHPAAVGRFGASARRLRRERRELTAAIDRQERYAESLADQIDDVLHPVLSRKDGHYQRLVATTALFGTAAEHCDAVSTHLAAAFGAGRTVTKAALTRNAGPSEQFQADRAAQRYDGHMRDAGSAIAVLAAQLTEIEGWVEALVRATLPPLPMPDLRPFDRLPRHLTNTGDRLRLAQSLGLLNTLQAEVRTTTIAIRKRQDLADRKRQAALRETYAGGSRPAPEAGPGK